MSHGKIYQLATKPIEENKAITPEEFYDNHDAYADWVGDEMEGADREECIGYLADTMKDLLTPVGGGVFAYKGMGEYLQGWVDAIHEKAQAITVENVMNYSPRAALKDIVNGTQKDSVDRFVIEEYSGRFAEPMAELVSFLNYQMKPGDLLYVGAIIDFHY